MGLGQLFFFLPLALSHFSFSSQQLPLPLYCSLKELKEKHLKRQRGLQIPG
jgi:hypothetical protein